MESLFNGKLKQFTSKIATTAKWVINDFNQQLNAGNNNSNSMNAVA